LGPATVVYATRAPPYWYHSSSLPVPDWATGSRMALFMLLPQAARKSSEKAIATANICRE
jgi:hypothetical protein